MRKNPLLLLALFVSLGEAMEFDQYMDIDVSNVSAIVPQSELPSANASPRTVIQMASSLPSFYSLISNGNFKIHYTLGSFDDHRIFTSSDVLEIVCDEGYRFGSSELQKVYIVCRNSAWVDTLRPTHFPSCTLVVVGCAMPRIANGYVDTRSKFMSGDHARIACFSGYALQPTDAQPLIRCNSDGSWGSFNEAPLSCAADTSTSCPRPVSIANGAFRIVQKDGSNPAPLTFRSGVRVTFYCNDGYRLTTNESPVITCVEGTWHLLSSSYPSCQLRRSTDRCGPVHDIPRTKYYVLQNVKADDAVSSRHNSYEKFSHGTRVIYVCDSGYHQFGSSIVECIKGEWSGRGPVCLRHRGCTVMPPTIPNAEFGLYPGEANAVAVDEDDSNVLASEGSQAFYFCQNGFQMSDVNATSLLCTDGEWVGKSPICEKLITCDAPMNVANANWVVGWVWGDYRVGAVARYSCNPGYSLVGVQGITCQSSGSWSDDPPQCVPRDEYCSAPSYIPNGYMVCKPNDCGLFPVGTEVLYFCKQGFERSPQSSSAMTSLTCVTGGMWRGKTPNCIPVYDVGVGFPEHDAGNPLTVVVSTSCTLIGVLVIIILAVMLRWIRFRRSAVRQQVTPPDLGQLQANSAMPAAPPYSTMPNEMDRLALIAFADDVFQMPAAPLPTYEEAVGTGVTYPYSYRDQIRRVPVGVLSRSSRNCEYRPLASVHGSVRDPGSNDNRRNSVVTTISNNLSAAGVSASFGSMDTISAVCCASDATSNSVTVNTYDSRASNRSMDVSQRAMRGSAVESSSARVSISNDVPLSDQRSAVMEYSMLERSDATSTDDLTCSLIGDNSSSQRVEPSADLKEN